MDRLAQGGRSHILEEWPKRVIPDNLKAAVFKSLGTRSDPGGGLPAYGAVLLVFWLGPSILTTLGERESRKWGALRQAQL